MKRLTAVLLAGMLIPTSAWASPGPQEPAASPAAAAAPPAAVLAEAAELKLQPRRDSPSLTVIGAGTAVGPGGRMANSEGKWVFVQHENLSGWLPESVLTR